MSQGWRQRRKEVQRWEPGRKAVEKARVEWEVKGRCAAEKGSAAPDGHSGVVGRHKDTKLRAAEALEQFLEPGT